MILFMVLTFLIAWLLLVGGASNAYGNRAETIDTDNLIRREKKSHTDRPPGPRPTPAAGVGGDKSNSCPPQPTLTKSDQRIETSFTAFDADISLKRKKGKKGIDFHVVLSILKASHTLFSDSVTMFKPVFSPVSRGRFFYEIRGGP